MRRNDTRVVMQFIGFVAACVFAYGLYFSILRVADDVKNSGTPASLSGRIQKAWNEVATNEQFDMQDLTRKAGTHVKETANAAYKSLNRYASYVKNRPPGFLGNITDFFYGNALKQNRCYQSQKLNKATRVYDNITSGDKLLQDSKNAHNISIWSKVFMILLALLVLILLIRRNVKRPMQEEQPASTPRPTAPARAQEQQVPKEGRKAKSTSMYDEDKSSSSLDELCSKYNLSREEMITLYGDEKKANSRLKLYDMKCLNAIPKMTEYVDNDRCEKKCKDIMKEYDLHINIKSVYGSYREGAEDLQQYISECDGKRDQLCEIINRDISFRGSLRSMCKKYNLDFAYVLSVYGDIEDTYGHLQAYSKQYGSDKSAVIQRVHEDERNKGGGGTVEVAKE